MEMVFRDSSDSDPSPEHGSNSEDVEDMRSGHTEEYAASFFRTGSGKHPYLVIYSALLLILILGGILLVPAPLNCPLPVSSPVENSQLLPIKDTMEPPCGSTRESALARGCHFDLMSFTWLPDRCYDGELESEFLSSHSWIWYHDIEGTQEADKAKVYRGELETLFVNWEYHKTHCVFMWQKLHRAMERGWPVDGYIGTMNHTRHCLKQLDRKGIDPKAINTEILVKWPTCPEY